MEIDASIKVMTERRIAKPREDVMEADESVRSAKSNEEEEGDEKLPEEGSERKRKESEASMDSSDQPVKRCQARLRVIGPIDRRTDGQSDTPSLQSRASRQILESLSKLYTEICISSGGRRRTWDFCHLNVASMRLKSERLNLRQKILLLHPLLNHRRWEEEEEKLVESTKENFPPNAENACASNAKPKKIHTNTMKAKCSRDRDTFADPAPFRVVTARQRLWKAWVRGSR